MIPPADAYYPPGGSICGRSLGIPECICGDCRYRIIPDARAYEASKLRTFVSIAEAIGDYFATEDDRVGVRFASALVQTLRERLAALDGSSS